MKKMFISITVPGHLQEWMHSLLPDHKCFVRPMPGQFHITLRYIGETEAETLSHIQDCLRTVKAEPLTISTQGTGFFPNDKNPRVLWLGIKNNRELNELASAIDDQLSAIIERPREHPFHPHITLARLRSGHMPLDSVRKIAKGIEGDLTFDAGSFQLMESVSDSGSAVHRVIENYKLNRN
jgi:RNA 2',3'-cyclic 3'-phosphodiesterase